MGSKTFDGVWFISYSDDHLPPHVHGLYAGVTVIVNLLSDGIARKSKRAKSTVPPNAKRSDVRHVVKIAEQHADELMNLWRATHG